MRTSTTILELTAGPRTETTLRLPAPDPTGQLWSWRQRARCRGSDSSVFFPPDGERPSARRARERAAKAICARCPVRQPCAAYALSSRETYGVWGGLSESERAAVLRLHDEAPTPTPPTWWSA